MSATGLRSTNAKTLTRSRARARFSPTTQDGRGEILKFSSLLLCRAPHGCQPNFASGSRNAYRAMLIPSTVGRQAFDKGGEALSLIGMKRESSTPEPNNASEGPPNKRAKTAEGSGAKSLEVNAASMLFRKFVTNALDERASVGFVFPGWLWVRH